ncbi:MAG TPA: hypothetical protein VNK41_07785 [Vicinamibacterales bacterium]|nr:hypothetical protein [Vicinamibacterales bacterium]
MSPDNTATASSDRDRLPEDRSAAPGAATLVQQTASSARPRPETAELRRDDRSRETVRETQRAAVSEPAAAGSARAASASAPPASRPETPVRPDVPPAGAGPGSTVSRQMPDAAGGGTVARVEQPPAPQPSPATLPSKPPAVAASYVPTPNPAAQAASVRTQDGEAAVRQVLQRYIAAYNRLDAAAARDVWPSVNRSALERAFSQLDSQTLQFERCDVSVDEDGGTATCDGQARWVPRVGDRDPRRERRTWRFELARSGDDWIITRAEARR